MHFLHPLRGRIAVFESKHGFDSGHEILLIFRAQARRKGFLTLRFSTSRASKHFIAKRFLGHAILRHSNRVFNVPDRVPPIQRNHQHNARTLDGKLHNHALGAVLDHFREMILEP
jgi:hypothetical protein